MKIEITRELLVEIAVCVAECNLSKEEAEEYAIKTLNDSSFIKKEREN